MYQSRDSSVGIATGYGQDDQRIVIRVPVGQELSLLYFVQTSSGVHTISYKMRTGDSFLGGKTAGAPPTSSEVKKT
jgi:hypothetical protein